MPNYDGRGPLGYGPGSGRGLGPCMNPGAGRNNYLTGYGFGNPNRGFGRGLGPGGGRRFGGGRGKFYYGGPGTWTNFTLGPPWGRR